MTKSVDTMRYSFKTNKPLKQHKVINSHFQNRFIKNKQKNWHALQKITEWLCTQFTKRSKNTPQCKNNSTTINCYRGTVYLKIYQLGWHWQTAWKIARRFCTCQKWTKLPWWWIFFYTSIRQFTVGCGRIVNLCLLNLISEVFSARGVHGLFVCVIGDFTKLNNFMLQRI